MTDLSAYSTAALQAIADGQGDPTQVLITDAEQRHGLRSGFLGGIINRGENSAPDAVSPKGAVGIAQLMPATAADLGVSDRTDVGASIDAAARYTKQNLDRFGGDERMATAAYNAGPGAVARYGGVPPYRETQAYVDRAAGDGDAGSVPSMPDVSHMSTEDLQRLAGGDPGPAGGDAGGGQSPAPTGGSGAAQPYYTQGRQVTYADTKEPVSPTIQRTYDQLAAQGKLDPNAAPGSAGLPRPGRKGFTADPGEFYVDVDGSVKQQPAAPVDRIANPGRPADFLVGPHQENVYNPLDWLAASLRGTDAMLRGGENAFTGGFFDKALAAGDALPALFKGGLPAASETYSRHLDSLNARQAADYRDVPLERGGGALVGTVAQALALPEIEGGTLAARAAIGAGQGAGLGAFNAYGHARGGPTQETSEALKGALAGAAGGAVFGGAFGARPAAEAAAAATPADYAAVQVDPALAVNGPRMTQQVAQVLMGLPIVGRPLAAAAERTQGQAVSALDRIAGNYGGAADGEAAGSIISGLNSQNGDASAAAASRISAALQAVGDRLGPDNGRRVVGEDVQAGIRRFAGSNSDAPVLTPSLFPARVTSFGTKAGDLYGRAFGRLDDEIAGGIRGTANGPPADMSPALAKVLSDPAPMDQALNLVRAGRGTSDASKGPSLLNFIAKQGGLSDDGGELAAMDADRWHLGQPFRPKLVRDQGNSLEDMAQAAHEAGYFPDAKLPEFDSGDNMQAVTGGDLLDAIQAELAGNKRFAAPPSNAIPGLQSHVSDVEEMLSRLGIDPAKATNAQIKSAADRYTGGAGTPGVAADGVQPIATQAVIQDILTRAQSPAVQGLLDAPQVRTVAQAVNDPGSLSFKDLGSMRTWVRQAQKNDKLRQSIGDADLQRMESALTSDIFSNASRLGSPGGAQQLRRADQFYAAGQQRIGQALQGFTRTPSGEGAFDRIVSSASTGGGADAARLQALQRTLHPDEWREVASGVIGHLGSTPDGFDLGRFVQGYQKLSPQGRGIIFGGRNAALGRSLDDIAQRGAETLATPSVQHFGTQGPNSATASQTFEGLLSAARSRGRGSNIGSIHALKAALPDKEWGDVASGVLRTLGDDGNGGLSMARFVTGWDKLSPAGKAALFSRDGGAGVPADLNALVNVMRQQGRAAKFYNHSNSANSGGVMAGLVGAGKAAWDLAHGDVHAAAAVGAITAVGAGASKLLASPGFARIVLGKGGAGAPDMAAQLTAFARAHPDMGDLVERYGQEYLSRIHANAPVSTGSALGDRSRTAVRSISAPTRLRLPAPSFAQ